MQQQCLLRGWALPALAILNVQISAKHTGKERRAGMEISSSLSEVECNPLGQLLVQGEGGDGTKAVWSHAGVRSHDCVESRP